MRVILIPLLIFISPVLLHAQNPICGKSLALQNSQQSKVELSFEWRGKKSGDVLVMIHGLSGSRESFLDIAQFFGKKYRILIYDQRGHGKSPRVGYDFSSYVMARDLKNLLDQEGVTGKVSILGHSMGGRTAMRFADLFPELVQSLIIEDMDILRRSNPDPKIAERTMILARAVREKFEGKGFKSTEDIQKTLEPYFRREAEDLAGYAFQDNDGLWYMPISLYVHMLYYYQPYTELFTDAVIKYSMPTLFLRSDTEVSWSAISDVGWSKLHELSQQNAQIKLKMISGSNHGIHHSQKEKFLDTVWNSYCLIGKCP